MNTFFKNALFAGALVLGTGNAMAQAQQAAPEHSQTSGTNGAAMREHCERGSGDCCKRGTAMNHSSNSNTNANATHRSNQAANVNRTAARNTRTVNRTRNNAAVRRTAQNSGR